MALECLSSETDADSIVAFGSYALSYGDVDCVNRVSLSARPLSDCTGLAYIVRKTADNDYKFQVLFLWAYSAVCVPFYFHSSLIVELERPMWTVSCLLLVSRRIMLECGF